MKGVPLFEVSKLLRHASIQMTERYAHLAPDYLHDAVASLRFSAQLVGEWRNSKAWNVVEYVGFGWNSVGRVWEDGVKIDN